MIYPLASNLNPWITAEFLHKIDADPSWQSDEMSRCAEEPWYWAVNYVYTIRKDEFTADDKPEVLRFPPKLHLRQFLHLCFTEPFLTADKSRQMTLSWAMMVYYAHIATFGEHEEIIIQTKKEIDASALVGKASFILGGLRQWMRPDFTFSEGKGGKLVVAARHNTLRGLPGGAGAGDQVRSANPSRYLLDEAGFVDEFEDCRTNAEACCQDIKLISTANSGEYQVFIHDLIGEAA